MPAADAFDLSYSFMLDDSAPNQPRWEVRERIEEILGRPFDEEEAQEYDRDLWAKRNLEAAAQMSIDPEADFVQAP